MLVFELRMTKQEVLEKFGAVLLETLFSRGGLTRYYTKQWIAGEEVFFASSTPRPMGDSVSVKQLLELDENLSVNKLNGYMYVQTRERS